MDVLRRDYVVLANDYWELVASRKLSKYRSIAYANSGTIHRFLVQRPVGRFGVFCATPGFCWLSPGSRPARLCTVLTGYRGTICSTLVLTSIEGAVGCGH